MSKFSIIQPNFGFLIFLRETVFGSGTMVQVKKALKIVSIERRNHAFRSQITQLQIIFRVAHIFKVVRVGACDNVQGVENRVQLPELPQFAPVGELGSFKAAVRVDFAQYR